jgi:hypothetical protein
LPQESQVKSAPLQIQQWIDTHAVNVVYHHEFLPSDALPTFNPNYVNAHLHRIQNLEQFFVTVGFGEMFGRPVLKQDLLAKTDDGAVVQRLRLSRRYSDMLTQFKDTSKGIYRKTVAANAKVIEELYKDKSVKNPRRLPSPSNLFISSHHCFPH